MPSRKVDVKAQRQRARHEDLIFIQLGHVNIERLAEVGSRRVESDALDNAQYLHGAHCLFSLSWAAVIWHLSVHCESYLAQTLYFQSRNVFLIKNCVDKYIAMAEGGDFAYEDEDLDDDDEEVNTIRPFQPGAASTPYQRGDQYEMQTMQHEQSGLPSYDETTQR